MRVAKKAWLGGVVVAALVGVVAACSSGASKAGADGGAGPHATACAAAPGEMPPAECDDSSNDCAAGACAIDEAKCGSASTCLPMASNKGKDVLDLRMRRINVVAPPQLAAPFVQGLIVGRNVDLAAPECGDPAGRGSFTWLVRLDKGRGKLVTGGAPPSKDPFGLGYCFARARVGAIDVAPVELDVRIEGDRVVPTAGFPKLNVPIYVDGNVDNVVILPISEGRLEGFTLSADGDCVGRFEKGGLDSACNELTSTCTKWKTGGNLAGYITLEEADKVVLRDLDGRTLCGYLTGNTQTKACARDASGAISAKGDYCAATKRAGDCGDAYWLAATFAASAVRIHAGDGVPQCGAATPLDAGRD